MNYPEYYLLPQFDSRKSFYEKARVRMLPDGEMDLISYGSRVATIYPDGDVALYKDWDTSQTTLRHVKEFLRQNGYRADSKRQIEARYGT